MPPTKEQLRNLKWNHVGNMSERGYQCGYCEKEVSSHARWSTVYPRAGIWICSTCKGPTFFFLDDYRLPDVQPGPSVPGLPTDLERAYREARDSVVAGAYTGAVMLCRKMLMHVAVDKGGKLGRKFVEYVDYLVKNGHVPADSQKAVDFVRTRGNDANHEIPHMTRDDAEKLVNFTGMLLLFAYAFPNFMQETPAGL